MTDIIEKLRLTYQTAGLNDNHTHTVHLNPDGEEAAREIEELRIRNAVLRDVVKDMERQITDLHAVVDKIPRQVKQRRFA
jgi:hypothetical protein